MSGKPGRTRGTAQRSWTKLRWPVHERITGTQRYRCRSGRGRSQAVRRGRPPGNQLPILLSCSLSHCFFTSRLCQVCRPRELHWKRCGTWPDDRTAHQQLALQVGESQLNPVNGLQSKPLREFTRHRQAMETTVSPLPTNTCAPTARLFKASPAMRTVSPRQENSIFRPLSTTTARNCPRHEEHQPNRHEQPKPPSASPAVRQSQLGHGSRAKGLRGPSDTLSVSFRESRNTGVPLQNTTGERNKRENQRSKTTKPDCSAHNHERLSSLSNTNVHSIIDVKLSLDKIANVFQISASDNVQATASSHLSCLISLITFLICFAHFNDPLFHVVFQSSRISSASSFILHLYSRTSVSLFSFSVARL